MSCGNAVLLPCASGNPTGVLPGAGRITCEAAAHRYILPPGADVSFRSGEVLHHPFLGFLCVCVCVHRKEWEGETAHFLCPLIRSVVTMALRRIQLS